MRATGWPIAALALLLAAPALAQDPVPTKASGIEDLRPRDAQFPDNMGIEELPIGPVPAEFAGDQAPSALIISNQIFGARVDDAYGAFQRGYYLTALNLALPRAEKGDHVAQTLIGEIYAKGLGVGLNLARAASWSQLASAGGDALATFELATMYQDGTGVEKDRKRAAALFKAAAEAGNIMAKYNLGLLHIEGIYVEPNIVKAAALIKEAAEAGIAEARYDYAGMLTEGAGVAPDPKAAAEQFRLAAESGMVSAEVDYATVLYLGKGVEKDREAAAGWYGKAADAGNAVAQNRYAKLLAAGEGIAADPETAAMWRALARRQGLNDAALDKLLEPLQPEQLARAEERARFWPLSPPTKVADTGTPPVVEAATAPDAP